MKKGRMNKLIESKLRKLVQKEIKSVLKEISDSELKFIDSELESYFNKLVPRSGKSDTIEGEMIRAINRIIYRYFNDGDVFFSGYGKETVLPSVNWLVTKSPIAKILKSSFSSAKKNAKMVKRSRWSSEPANSYTENDGYQSGIYDAAKKIINYVKSKNGEYTPNKEHDSRN